MPVPVMQLESFTKRPLRLATKVEYTGFFLGQQLLTTGDNAHFPRRQDLA
jgi:hypothetical protein